MKAIALISAVIFIGLTLAAATIIYNAGMPVVTRMQNAASVEKMKGVFSETDMIVEDVASEGNGSKRTVSLRF
jgi:MFS superfamily sulfate permease-like transporter